MAPRRPHKDAAKFSTRRHISHAAEEMARPDAVAMLAVTDVMQPVEITFRSGESRKDLLLGFSNGLLAAASFWSAEENRAWVTGALLLLAGIFFWLAWVRWRLPCVRLGGDRLVVYQGRKPKHVLHLPAVKAVRRGFNSTRLELDDGITLSVSSLNFVSGEDVRRFREALAGILAGQSAPRPVTGGSHASEQ
jgi:hypothetical protein